MGCRALGCTPRQQLQQGRRETKALRLSKELIVWCKPLVTGTERCLK